jgi:outer membrane protein OmpA-like peptidoglycan-associated protein
MRPMAAVTLSIVLAVPLVRADEEPKHEHDHQAEALLAELGGDLFGGQAASEVDQRLLADIHDELERIDFTGDAKGEEIVRSVFGANPLSREGNPLLADVHRKRWLSTAIASVGYETVTKHLKHQTAELQQGKVDREAWYKHVATCTRICNPVVQGLLYEHVRQVAARPHLLVTFQVDQATISPTDLVELDRFVGAAAEHGARFLLIGRASRTGNREYNRELSARRVESTRTTLTRLGVAEDAIAGFWLGYEPPQITDEIARVYSIPSGLDPLTRNQSVLVVAYR